ncbi:helix-turn-helix domain-containing protein [Paracoccus shanxieyensis]|uniref:Helix-turn-helix domain-containing protein n=1 Tax=Paracoccus shanxieyensis TaxID=2675752 RepID=A0A6L6IYP0_9RHOB|nr:AraC family transcriptional regulator [Paracoccus shanxieyensis]MTH64741.1 helix-turn-helix domain-containing protein [Paracoccus shanxieyensis]MTH88026.1 helix-turn-helix domain-containing protein [Paracoccus shanxieyensis]
MTNTLRHLPRPEPRLDDDGIIERLMRAGITAGVILEPSQVDLRAQQDSKDAETVLTARPAPAPGHLPRSAPGDGLRLVPLAAFHWGGAARGRFGGQGPDIAPRVRGDHILIRVTDGTLAIRFPGQQHPLTADRIALIPAGTAFSMQPPADVQGCALLIPPHLVKQLQIPFPTGFRSGLPDPADQALIEPALLALGHGSPRNPTEVSATACHLGLLSVALSRLAEGSQAQRMLNQRVTEAQPLTERFLALAGANIARNQTIAELARDLGCTQTHLDRACQQSRGKRALDLLYRLRLDRAASLLRDTNMTAGQIARDLGFSGLGHFVRSFAAATGRTPEDFRAIHRNPPQD